MIPEEGAPGEPARPPDLAAGLLRSFWPWIVAGAAVVAFLAFLLWGANRPDDPEVRGAGRTATTPADGLDFEEALRRVGRACLELLVADEGPELVSGLRYRESELDRVDGMLFVAPAPQTSAFTMAGVVEPLQIGFYDAGGHRLGGHRMRPCDGTLAECPGYEPPGPWTFALETAPGELPRGDLGGRCPRRRGDGRDTG